MQNQGVTDKPTMLMFVGADDVDASIAFYRDAFAIDFGASYTRDGITTSLTWPNISDGRGMHYALCDHPRFFDTSLTWHAPVSDLEATHTKAVAAGAQVVSAPHTAKGGTEARYVDPAGNTLVLRQPA